MGNFSTVFIYTPALSQLQKGNWVIGANGRLSVKPSNLTTLLESHVGYMVGPRLELGVGMMYTYSRFGPRNHTNSLREFSLTFRPYSRYYFFKPEKRFNIFAEAGMNASLIKRDDQPETNFYHLQTNLSAGLIYFMRPRIALEAKIGYVPTLYSTGYTNLYNYKSTIGIKFRLGD